MAHDNYKEYETWVLEKSEFIKKLEEKAPNISSAFAVELEILNILYELGKRDEKFDEDHDDVFYFGFDFLNYVYSSLELLAVQLYENSLELMDEFASDILAYIYIDSLTLNVDMELSNIEGDHQDALTELDKIIEETEFLLQDRKTVTEEHLDEAEGVISKILDDYNIDIYLDDELLLEYAEEHGIIQFEEEE